MDRRSVLTGGLPALLGLGAASMLLGSTPALAHSGCTCWEELPGFRVTNCCVPLFSDYPDLESFKKATIEYGGYGHGPDGYILWDPVAQKFGEPEAHDRTSHGNHMAPNTIAVDPDIIAHGTKIWIPGVTPPPGYKYFVANDFGPDFKGQKWVNFLSGEGAAACAAIIDRVQAIYIWPDDDEPNFAPMPI